MYVKYYYTVVQKMLTNQLISTKMTAAGLYKRTRETIISRSIQLILWLFQLPYYWCTPSPLFKLLKTDVCWGKWWSLKLSDWLMIDYLYQLIFFTIITQCLTWSSDLTHDATLTIICWTQVYAWHCCEIRSSYYKCGLCQEECFIPILAFLFASSYSLPAHRYNLSTLWVTKIVLLN